MFEQYKTLIFDCDGVILDSNRLKSEAFYTSVLSDGHLFSTELLKYHKENGGISRYKKFEHYLNVINPRSIFSLSELLDSYKKSVVSALLNCPMSSGFESFIKKNVNSHCMVISGGDEIELNHVFNKRKISCFFDGGIFGSPCDKNKIISAQIESENIVYPAIFFGDSKYDYEVAIKNGIDFIYLHELSDIVDHKAWVHANNIKSYKNFNEIC